MEKRGITLGTKQARSHLGVVFFRIPHLGRLVLFAAGLLASEWAVDTNWINTDASLLIPPTKTAGLHRREENIGYKDALLAFQPGVIANLQTEPRRGGFFF